MVPLPDGSVVLGGKPVDIPRRVVTPHHSQGKRKIFIGPPYGNYLPLYGALSARFAVANILVLTTTPRSSGCLWQGEHSFTI